MCSDQRIHTEVGEIRRHPRPTTDDDIIIMISRTRRLTETPDKLQKVKISPSRDVFGALASIERFFEGGPRGSEFL
jgi:hypothetical protein